MEACAAPQVWRAPPGTASRDTSKQFGSRQNLPPDVCCCRGGWKWQGSSGFEPLQVEEALQVPPTSGLVHHLGIKTCTRSLFSLINNQSKIFHRCIVWLQRNDWNLECTLQHAPMRINSLCEKSLALFSTSSNLSANGVLTFLPFARCSIRIRTQEANCWLG